MKFGADPKKTIFLGILVLIGGYEFYDNVLAGPSSSGPSRPVRPAATGSALAPIEALPETARRATAPSRSSEEFRPSLKPKRPEERVDPMTIDPTLRTDLLAKVQAVGLPTANRNLFQYGAAPAPPLPKEPTVEIKKAQAVAEAAKAAAAAAPPPPPPPPPIMLKYYGFSSVRGDPVKRAFFLDGEDILVGAEGDTVKKRYRIVKIGVNSVTMEDTQFKHEQTLPLAPEANNG